MKTFFSHDLPDLTGHYILSGNYSSKGNSTFLDSLWGQQVILTSLEFCYSVWLKMSVALEGADMGIPVIGKNPSFNLLPSLQ